MKRFAVARPVTTLCLVVIGVSLPLLTGLLVAGVDLLPGKLAELVLLTGTATLITSWIGGRPAVRRLFGGLTRWRIGAGRWAVVLLAMPVLTVGVAAATGTLHWPERGWAGKPDVPGAARADRADREPLGGDHMVGLRPATADRPARPARRLDAHRDPVRADPPASRVRGRRVGRHDLVGGLRQLGVPAGALPFLRYVIGVLLVDTRGSVLAAAMLHASFNASGALSVVPDGWQYVPALVVLTVMVALHRRLRGRSLVEGRVSDGPVSVAVARSRASSRQLTASGRARRR